MPEMITYETIRAAYREEKKEGLQPLPKEFWSACAKWIAAKVEKYKRNSELKDLEDIENAKSMLKDLFDRRERKILLLAMHHVRSSAAPKNLLPEEEGFFDSSVKLLRNARRDILERVISAKGPSSPKKTSKTQPKPAQNRLDVIVLEEIPAFVGTDEVEYGPLRPGDEINLPKDVAELLIKRGVVKVKE
jgi:DNA replication initiation complex subunit (GINS family)